MVAEVVDAVIVVDAAVRVDRIISTKTVLHDEEGQVIVVGEPVQGVPQADGIHLPAPVGSLDMGVPDKVAPLVVLVVGIFGLVLDREGHIVAEPDVIHTARFQGSEVGLRDVQLVALPLPQCGDVRRVGTQSVDIGVIVAVLHGFLGLQDVGRVAGEGVDGAHGDHAAHLQAGVDLMSGLHRQRTGDQLIMGGLIHQQLGVLALLGQEA